MDETPRITTYGKALKAERQRLDLTQAKLAEMAGTTQQNIQGIEAGRSIPGTDIHDKLVEIFGRHTPLVNTARRGDIVLAADAIANAKATSVLFSERVQPLRDSEGRVSNTEMSQWWADGAARSAKEMEDAIGNALPQELRQHLRQRIDSGKRALRPDYLSDKLVVEWKFVAGNNLANASRVGMQQLCVFKAALEREPAAPRRYILALVTSHLEAMRSTAVLATSEEADLLGVEVFFCNDGAAVAKSVALAEYGADNEEFEDEGFLYNAPPPK
jgi:transcriptional regulator with XRE-family HTH domain